MLSSIPVALLAFSFGLYAQPMESRPVKVAPIELGPMTYHVSTYGVLAPNIEDLSFQIAGRIETFLVEEGSKVRAGQTLARLETQDAQDQLSQMQVALDQASRRLERIRRLHDEGSIQQSQLEDAEDEFERVRISFEQARLHLERCFLKAPEDGLVLKEYIESRTTVTPGIPIFSFQRAGQTWIADVELIDRHAFALGEGSRAEVRFAPYPGMTFSGELTKLAGIANPDTALFTAEITVKADGHQLRPGMIAEVELFEESAGNFSTVPLDAIVDLRNNAGTIFVIDGDTVKEVAVTVGAINGLSVSLVERIEGYERVVIRGQENLRDGDPVRILED